MCECKDALIYGLLPLVNRGTWNFLFNVELILLCVQHHSCSIPIMLLILEP